ncbi:hypothetical protein ACYOEI_04045 [Singulisphaera rosea]
MNSALTLDGTPVIREQVITTVDIAAGKLKFTPQVNRYSNGTEFFGFDFEVRDDGGTANGGVDTSSSREITFNVIWVNDAPVGTTKTVTILKGTTYTFGINDFGFTDPNDNLANFFTDLTITSLPAVPGLTFFLGRIQMGEDLNHFELSVGELKVTPGNANGTFSFGFKVRDSGGTANGGVDTDPISKTITINVTPVNSAPVGVSKAFTIAKGSTYVLTAADFGFSDPYDITANNFLGVKIVDSSNAGGLTLDGTPVTQGLIILVSDINAGKLKYTQSDNTSTDVFSLIDDGGTANGGRNTGVSNSFIFRMS